VRGFIARPHSNARPGLHTAANSHRVTGVRRYTTIAASTAGNLEVTFFSRLDGGAVERFPAHINEFLIFVKKLYLYGKIPRSGLSVVF
jgi:hypothetical protein